MIKIDKAEYEERACNCCYSKEKVIEISFSDGHIGTTIALCEKCANDLKIILRERYGY